MKILSSLFTILLTQRRKLLNYTSSQFAEFLISQIDIKLEEIAVILEEEPTDEEKDFNEQSNETLKLINVISDYLQNFLIDEIWLSSMKIKQSLDHEIEYLIRVYNAVNDYPTEAKSTLLKNIYELKNMRSRWDIKYGSEKGRLEMEIALLFSKLEECLNSLVIFLKIVNTEMSCYLSQDLIYLIVFHDNILESFGKTPPRDIGV